MTALDASLRALRAAALRTERASQRAILAAWQRAWANLGPYAQAAVAQALAAQAELPAAAAVAALPTVRSLTAAIGREMQVFGMVAATATVAGQRAAEATAPALARAAVLAALGTPPPGAGAIALVTPSLFTPNETAARSAATIARLAPGMGHAGAKAIADGVRAGKGARAIARDVRVATNVGPVRALLVSRTSINEAYRRASMSTFRQNAGVLEGWIWVAALSRRTCAACWAKHGSFHTLDETLNSHPACRCAMAPRTKRWAELGFPDVPDTRPEIRDGAALFGELPVEDQRHILGPGKYDLWVSGAIELADLVGETFSPIYGPGMRERSLRELKAS